MCTWILSNSEQWKKPSLDVDMVHETSFNINAKDLDCLAGLLHKTSTGEDVSWKKIHNKYGAFKMSKAGACAEKMIAAWLIVPRLNFV